MAKNLSVCILAARQSTRMKSKLSKMLHPLCGKPVILHVHRVAAELKPDPLAVVVGYQKDQLTEAFPGDKPDFVVQDQQLGTGHAVEMFLRHYPSLDGLLLIMNGDTPLLRVDTLRQLINAHSSRSAAVSLLTTDVDKPQGYGRIVRNNSGLLVKIVEEADADDEEKAIREINSGIYIYDVPRLRELLPGIRKANRQKEYYLPDTIELALRRKWTVLPITAPVEEVAGINHRIELAEAARILRRRINEGWMREGVTMHDPDRTYIDVDVRFGTDVTLYPNVSVEGSSVVESNVTIYPNCRISDSRIESDCIVYDNTTVDRAHLERGVKIGPFARIRPESVVKEGARIGNFVELKKTTMGEGSKANHLTYLGDATVGKDVNVGAGTITCNYDGVKKHPTVIEDGVFIGSNTELIAPVKVGKDAYVAAGSSITDDVPPGSLAIARGRQVNKVGWVRKKKLNAKKAKAK